MAISRNISIEDFINNHKMTGFQWKIIFLCFFVVAIDGFDTAAVGYIAPALKKEWALAPKQLSSLFGAGLFGLMVGAFLFGPLADRFGRRIILILSTLFFGLATLASSMSHSIEELMMWRFITGIGLGGAMPAAITLTSEFCPGARRSSLVTAMFCGFTVGAALGGLASAQIIATHGWQGVLLLGGIVPVIFAAVLAFFLPESVRYLVSRGNRDAAIARIMSRIAPGEPLGGVHFVDHAKAKGMPIGQIFSDGRLMGTLLLWVGFFMSLLVFYLLTSWLPTLLSDAGESLKSSALYALLLPIGSTVGALAIGSLMDRVRPPVVLGCSYALAAVFIALLGYVTGSPLMLALFIFGAGVGTGGSQVGINAWAASYYPTTVRATGVSWANAVGRVGSIFGSMVGGYFLSLGWDLGMVFTMAAIPAVIASLAMFMVGTLRVPSAVPAVAAR